MTGETDGGRRHRTPWRVAGWGGAAALLVLPLLAMQFTGEVVWGVEDFVFAGVLVGGVGLAFEMAVRTTRSRTWRAGVAVALAAGFMLVWVNAAVGLIGSEDNPANLIFFGVLAVGIAGAALARFRPAGMARALLATALAQALAGVTAAVAGWGAPWSGPGEIIGLTAFFAALWLVSAGLFRKAAREQDRAEA